jgi:hypothetical protein
MENGGREVANKTEVKTNREKERKSIRCEMESMASPNACARSRSCGVVETASSANGAGWSGIVSEATRNALYISWGVQILTVLGQARIEMFCSVCNGGGTLNAVFWARRGG